MCLSLVSGRPEEIGSKFYSVCMLMQISLLCFMEQNIFLIGFQHGKLCAIKTEAISSLPSSHVGLGGKTRPCACVHAYTHVHTHRINGVPLKYLLKPHSLKPIPSSDS